jgi:Ceramidase
MSAITKAAAFTILSMMATWLLLDWLAPYYASYAPATCTTTHCFCEAPRLGGAMMQPANSWSAFGYVFVGLFLVFEARSKTVATAFPVSGATTYGIGAITVGIGSVMLHGTLTLWGQFADVFGMYLVAGFSLVYAIANLTDMEDKSAAILYFAVCSVLVAALIIEPEVRRWLFFAILATALFIEIGFARHKRKGVILQFLLFAMLAKAVAFGIWTLDQQRLLCVPDSIFQGHAVWHLLGAVSLFLTSRYYRSEQS